MTASPEDGADVLRTLLVALLVITLLLVVGSASYQPVPVGRKGDGNSPMTEAKGQQQKPHNGHDGLLLPVLPSRGPQGEVNAQQSADQDRQDSTAKRIFLATCALVVVTLLLAGGTFWQVCVTRASAERQLRAYLCVVPEHCIAHECENKAVQFEPTSTIINTGQTPASEICYVATADVLSLPLDDRAARQLPEDKPSSEVYLGPTHRYIITKRVDKVYNAIEATRADRCVFIWGRVSYKDVFGKNRRTEFCHGYRWGRDSEGKLGAVGDFAGGNRNKAT